MIFSESYTTTWDDTDYRRQVSPSRLLVYMQETSNRHMMHAGMSLDGLRDKRGLAFILSKITLDLYKPLFAYEPIEVQTWTCPGRGYSIFRCFRILRGEDVIAAAHTTWALVDLGTRRFVRGEESGYAFEDEAPLVLQTPARARFPENWEKLGERTVRYSDLDYNMHMNNTRYPDMICDFLPRQKVETLRGMTLFYLHEAADGDTVEILHGTDGAQDYIRTRNGEGTTCLEALLITG